MPGPAPKPTALKLIQGAKNKRQINPNEPKPEKPEKVPEPPGYLGKKGVQEWKRIAKELYDLGILTAIDTLPLANYCMAFEDMLTAKAQLDAWNKENPDNINMVLLMTGRQSTHPLVAQVRNHRADMMRFAQEFGLTPASRTRVVVKSQRKTNEFEKF